MLERKYVNFLSNIDVKTVPSWTKTPPQSRPSDFHIWVPSHASAQVVAVTGQRCPFLDGISPPPTLHLHDNSTEKASRPGDGRPARRGTPRPAGEAEARLRLNGGVARLYGAWIHQNGTQGKSQANHPPLSSCCAARRRRWIGR